jgi:hypothetical protein
MDQINKTSLSGQPKFVFSPLMKIGLLALIVVVITGGVFAAINLNSQSATSKTVVVPTSPQIEEKWGIRVSQIGVTADGGMVDFRFVVVDPNKALELMSKPDNLPILAAEDSGIYVNSAAIMSTRHDLNAGTTYFLLFRNTQGAIKPGTKVSVLFPDELKLQHVVAR